MKLNLNTKNLNGKEVNEVINDLRIIIEKIKNANSSQAILDLFNYTYVIQKNGEMIKIIDIKLFIDNRTNKKLDELGRADTDSRTRSILKSEAKSRIYERIKNKFEFEEGHPRKILNSFLEYINWCIKSAIYKYFQNIEEYKLNKHAFSYSEEADYSTINIQEYNSPDQICIDKENIELIEKCIQKLPEKQEEVINKHVFENKKQVTIAKEMGNTQQAVSKLFRKAQDNLYNHLIERGLKKVENYIFQDINGTQSKAS